MVAGWTVSDLPEDLLQVTRGMTSDYLIRRVSLGESVTGLTVTRTAGGLTGGVVVLTCEETPDGWAAAAAYVTSAVVAEIRDEESG